MNKSKAISRIERVLKKLKDNAFTDSDIDILFVTARELPSATKNIFEIGSFVAHIHKRDQGVINDMMLRNHLLLKIKFGYDKYNVNSKLNKFPKYFPLLIKLQLKMFNDEQLKKKTGLKGGQINTVRKKLNNKKSYKIEGEVCKLTADIGINEMLIINEVLSLLNCSDSIKFNVLFDELKCLLKKEIPDADLTPLDDNKMKIAGVLMCLMNNINFSSMGMEAKTIIMLEFGKPAKVYGQYPISDYKEPFKKGYFTSPVFDAEYDVAELFDRHVTDENIKNGDIEFSFDLEKIVALKP